MLLESLVNPATYGTQCPPDFNLPITSEFSFFEDFDAPNKVVHMPYTPPSQRSPAASRPETPALSRSQSHVKPSSSPGYSTGPRPGLPRSCSSASYLQLHRRSPSLAQQRSAAPSTPDATPSNDRFNERDGGATSSSLKQSPPPVNELKIPTGAVMSPPDSALNSSDEEDTSKRGRERELENLAELQAAVSVIEQHREGSPNRLEEAKRRARLALGLKLPLRNVEPDETSSPPLSQEARKISHSRSQTETAFAKPNRPAFDSPERSSESDEEVEIGRDKPPMLRKKSGELVRPALRPASAKRRPSSMPGTPTYSKAVHFDSHLEHVRHFLQVDRPLAVSANSSPVENYEQEREFPFGGGTQEPPFEWEIRLSNFPQETVNRAHMPVRVERVFLSAEKKSLIGTVAVQNLAFHKFVVARFTLDYWKTTSEVAAEYSNDVRRLQNQDGCDRFNFSIKLEDQANLENKTLFFCVRYNVNGQEFWDSNGHINYQVDFSKKALPQKGKQGMAGNASRSLVSLPRSRPPPPISSEKPRPLSASSFDDFAHGFEGDFKSFSPAASIIGEKPFRFRNKKSADIVSDAPGLRAKAPSQAFGTRYDFGASLSAAIQAASTTLGERSALQPKQSWPSEPSVVKNDSGNENSPAQKANGTHSTPAAISMEKPPLQSQSYNDLIDKYCFVRSKAPIEEQPSR